MGDIVPARQKAIKRALKDLPTHESLREQINPAHQIAKINDLIVTLETNVEMAGIGVNVLDQNQMASIKFALEARLKLLDKSMPSLKSVEVKQDGGEVERITFVMNTKPREEK